MNIRPRHLRKRKMGMHGEKIDEVEIERATGGQRATEERGSPVSLNELKGESQREESKGRGGGREKITREER